MNNITEQVIRLKLENRGIPRDVAEEAARIIAPSLDEGNVAPLGQAVNGFLQSFVAAYNENHDAVAALKALDESIIK